MVQKIIMPSGGQTTDEMLIVKWYKTKGDSVKTGDLIFEIETDKASMSVESYAEGILLAVKYGEGDRVKAGEVVAYIGNPGDKIPDEQEKIKSAVRVTSRQKKVAGTITASPLARAKAKTENLKIKEIANHFSKNLIKKSDIDNYLITKHLSDPGGDYYLIETTSMRRAIAKRMKESVLAAPHYIVSVDVDMTEIVILRNKLNNEFATSGIRISYNDILMKITASAIGTFPLINSCYLEDKIKVFNDVNIGLAVGLENGLTVPVVKQVNKKSIAEIAATNAVNIEAAKNNRLKEQDISGGTITLSNLGMSGINNFTAVINQPESCILAVGAIIEKPAVKDHQIVIREMMNITGSFDHRVIDGSYGAAFLKRIREMIENPQF
jgi:pyruvate dehydrogenase E2 component (dihydrolipoamide acetyltransferase)